MRPTDAALAALLVLASGAALAGELRGPARVIDGDTLVIGAVHVRLHGVDAPETRQTCGLDAGDWDCGAVAAARLRTLVDGREVRCEPQDLDKYGRVVARCSAGGVDVGGQLVAEGLARAYVRYSEDYVAAEDEARARHVGLWQGQSEAPWDYRAAGGFSAAAGTAPAGTAPAGCRIKGSVTARGHIYHLPGTAAYDRTRIDTRRGDAWFCDEAAALAAGFRAARTN
jgi:endonuclease YncB( thermonuclease family)